MLSAAYFPAVRSSFRLLVASTLAILLGGCGAGNFGSNIPAATGSQVKLEGFVHGGQQPIVGSTVQLYAAGSSADQSAATPLIAAAPVTDASGAFSITGLYTCPSITTEVYLIAKGGNPGLAPGTDNQQSVMMSALGPCGNLTSATHIIINEVTTIGSIYPITPFMASYLNVGAAPANQLTLANDFMQINQFIDTDGGQSPGPQLPGGFTAPVSNLNSLANSVAACVNTPGGAAPGGVTDGTPCGNLFAFAKPPAGPVPTNTADAILDIANNPNQNVANIYLLATGTPTFQPTLSVAPPDWTLKILPNIVLTTPSNLVGIGSPTVGTISLAQAAPAGGLTVNLVSSNSAAVSVTTPVVIPAGSSSASFNYIGIGAGTSTITATASGYYPGSTTLSSTSSLISLGTIPTVAPGQSVSLPLSLGTPAPAGGVTVNFTSASPGIATVTPSVFIPAGLQIPAANPQVTGITVGTAIINASATGYAPGARNASVSVTATLPSTFSVPLNTPTNETLTISAPAPAGGVTFALTVDNPAIFSVPSTVTVPAGSTTVAIPITGLTGGTTNLRANSTNIPEAVSAVTVNGSITLQLPTVITGKQLQTSTYFYFNAAPPSAVTATVTSANPAVAVVSTNPNAQGGATATIAGIINSSANSYYVQGVGVGSTTLTISAPGYNNTNVNVTVDPSGFVIYTPGSISTTTLSPDSTVSIYPAYLNPATSAVLGYAAVTPAASVNVTVASSDTTVATILNSPLTFGPNVNALTATFHPVGAGTANISLTTPAGFTTPNLSQQIVATVSAPPIGVQTPTFTTGKGLENSTYAYLTQIPLVPTTVSITSSNPAVAVVSSSATVAGAATININNIVNSSAFSYFVQGLTTGTTTITIAASPYVSATVAVTVDPSGFVIYSPSSISTTTFSTPTGISIFPAVLNPATLAVLGYGAVIPQFAPANVVFASSNTGVGTIVTSPLVFQAGDSSQSTSFQPVGAGTSTLSLATPANFVTPSNISTQQITATVTAPPIGLQTSTLTTGNNLQVASYVFLSQTPPTPVTITLTIDNPAIAVISTNSTLAGAASNTFPNTVNTNAKSFYLQGQSVGTATITVSAPGYQSSTIGVTVDPSGFVIYSPNSISTTTFSPVTSVTVFPAILNPVTSAVLGYGSFNPGIGTITVPVTSSAVQVGTVTTPLSFGGGSSSASFTFTPIAAGTSNLSIATPAGFTTPTPALTQQIVATVSAPPIGVQTTNLGTGQNLQVATYAFLSQTPPSPVTLTVTSADPTIASISTSLTVAGGATIAFPNVINTVAKSYYVQGHNQGTTTITVSAPGFSNQVVNVSVTPSGFVIYSPNSIATTTFSGTTAVTIFPAYLIPGTLTVLGYGAINPGVGSPQVAVASSVTSVGTVTSPVTFNAGDSSGSFAFQPVNAGSTVLSITQPGGFSTPAPIGNQQITATVTAPPIGVQTASIATGANLQVATYAFLSTAPPAPVTLTVTSNNPGIAVVSTAPLVLGGATVTFPGTANSAAKSYYVQGISVGSTTLTISAPGFISATVNVAVDPSGFVIYSPNSIATTTFSSPSTVTIFPAVLNSGVLTVLGYATLNPGVSASVPVTSAATAVGTVTTPVNFSPGSSSGTFTFQPVGAGSSLLSLGAVAGFTTPSQVATQQITATVTAPTIGYQSGSLTTGANLQISTYAYLSVAPPAPVNVTITSADQTIVRVSTSSTVAGSQAIAFNGVPSTGALSYFVQGQAVGSTTITVSAPGFQNLVIPVTVDPSGFVIYTPGNFTTTAGAAATSISVYAAVLNPGLLTVAGYASLNPGIGTVSVPVGSTSPQIGSINATNLNFTAGVGSLTFQFTPLAVGTTNIVLTQPAGFTTPSQPSTYNIVATVN